MSNGLLHELDNITSASPILETQPIHNRSQGEVETEKSPQNSWQKKEK